MQPTTPAPGKAKTAFTLRFDDELLTKLDALQGKLERALHVSLSRNDFCVYVMERLVSGELQLPVLANTKRGGK